MPVQAGFLSFLCLESWMPMEAGSGEVVTWAGNQGGQRVSGQGLECGIHFSWQEDGESDDAGVSALSQDYLPHLEVKW